MIYFITLTVIMVTDQQLILETIEYEKNLPKILKNWPTLFYELKATRKVRWIFTEISLDHLTFYRSCEVNYKIERNYGKM
jgi:hypothetical protein